MREARVIHLASALGLLALGGCAAMPRESAENDFADIQQTVAERSGYRVHWYQGGSEDDSVAQCVDDMLEDKLTVNRATQIALLGNRRLQATYEELGIAQANLVQAGLLKNPIFDAVVSLRSGGGKAILDLGIVQDFVSVFTRSLRKSIAQSQLETEKLRVATVSLDMAERVQSLFYQLQAAEQTHELMHQVADSTEASRQAAEEIYEAGNISALQFNNEQVLHFETKLALSSAEMQARALREQLNSVMGVWGKKTQWKLVKRLPELPKKKLDLSNVEKRAIEKSLDLALARKKIDAAAQLLGLTEATRLVPDLELGVEGEREDDGWVGGPALEIEVPIFDQGQARQAAALSQLRRAQEAYTALAVEIRSAARGAREALQMARDRAAYIRQVLMPLRESIVSDTLLNYNAMQLGVFELLQAQRQQILTARQYIEALRDYWLARVRFELILSGRLVSPENSAAPAQAGVASAGNAGGH